MMPFILLTGANGFVGSSVLEQLVTQNKTKIRVVGRHLIPNSAADFIKINGLEMQTDWSYLVHGINVIVHTAARAHVMREQSANPLAEFRRVNVDGTLNLARQAAAAGVRRFVFISSIGVNGNTTELGKPFSAEDVSSPTGFYSISKMEAEIGLHKIAEQSGMEVVVIRPPLVYGGEKTKGNFLKMMRWLHRGIPLPLGAIHNQRSLVGLDNLVDLIITCCEHPAAANQTFLVSDGEDLSTTQLLQRLSVAMGKPARLVPVPTWMLVSGATLLGQSAIAQRLCSSLQVDISKTRNLLGWHPPITVDEGLKRTAASWLASANLQ